MQKITVLDVIQAPGGSISPDLHWMLQLWTLTAWLMYQLGYNGPVVGLDTQTGAQKCDV